MDAVPVVWPRVTIGIATRLRIVATHVAKETEVRSVFLMGISSWSRRSWSAPRPTKGARMTSECSCGRHVNPPALDR